VSPRLVRFPSETRGGGVPNNCHHCALGVTQGGWQVIGQKKLGGRRASCPGGKPGGVCLRIAEDSHRPAGTPHAGPDHPAQPHQHPLTGTDSHPDSSGHSLHHRPVQQAEVPVPPVQEGVHHRLVRRGGGLRRRLHSHQGDVRWHNGQIRFEENRDGRFERVGEGPT
jgi:hypothetical protein